MIDVLVCSWSFVLAVMMAAVIDIASNEQREVVRRLFRESGNVNVKTTQVCCQSVSCLFFCLCTYRTNMFNVLEQSNSIDACC
jgi:hypothetical protein